MDDVASQASYCKILPPLCFHQPSSSPARASSAVSYIPLHLSLISPRVFSQMVVRIQPRCPSGFLPILRVPGGSSAPAVTGKSKETVSDCFGIGCKSPGRSWALDVLLPKLRWVTSLRDSTTTMQIPFKVYFSI